MLKKLFDLVQNKDDGLKAKYAVLTANLQDERAGRITDATLLADLRKEVANLTEKLRLAVGEGSGLSPEDQVSISSIFPSLVPGTQVSILRLCWWITRMLMLSRTDLSIECRCERDQD